MSIGASRYLPFPPRWQDELNAQLEELEQEELDAKLLDVQNVPTATLPNVPTAELPTVATGTADGSTINNGFLHDDF